MGHSTFLVRMGGGAEALRRHLNFRQISHRFTSSFTNPSFQDQNGSHIMYWNMMILNPSRFKVEPHSKYWYFCIERVDLLSLRFSGKRLAISHLMAILKNRWKCKSATISLHRGGSLSALAPLVRMFCTEHRNWGLRNCFLFVFFCLFVCFFFGESTV